MKAVILCGGLGTRLSEETVLKPKPMIEIGGMPVLWHIMKIYAAHGIREFVLALGYKGEVIKDFFVNYRYRSCSITVEMHKGHVVVHEGDREDWTVHLLDTGRETQTGGRLKRAAQFIGREPFLATYGDGVTDQNISEVIAFHQKSNSLATVTAVRPPARFGRMVFEGDRVTCFEEKPQAGEGWINGGFFVLQPEIVDYIEGDATLWEREPMEQLAQGGQLIAYRHEGFWQCMDTLRDVRLLESLWQEGKAPWKVW
ncbi:MAG: glucose-1-phosphate cytidylyltransferase [bacterium]